ncbi:hypothetical protein LTR05_003124 [Lithohypha guttulata]|uniref:Uncharacterized protein n=1 Tax=Lithohypha guttulata TaxID=1690604 RepID=A0AAN7T3B1_9EURO|nr:hypothetical protein LTR05_003124 [Lithohypha guttulata]
MIHLPATGIDISQDDLNSHLLQLDIYQGLLKQGFKKREIIEYFKNRAAEEEAVEARTDFSDPVPTTLELCNKPPVASKQEDSCSPTTEHASSSSSNVSPPEVSLPMRDKATGAPGTMSQKQHVVNRQHAPRQSSLLRFVREVSSEESVKDNTKPRTLFSPQLNITYRPRSQTYSYDQSEMDDDDVDREDNMDDSELEHLHLDHELVPTSAESNRTTVRIVSNLRPEAETFTPLHVQQERENHTCKGKAKVDDDTAISISDDISLPSSPPLLPLNKSASVRSPSLPRIPRTPSGTTRQDVHQRYLDGSFTVYDDSVPARYQPQTPADLSRGQLLTDFHAAYTAPPGMIRSPAFFQGQYLHGPRQPSGDQSPAARAQSIRERRQREFSRGARVERLRVTRMSNGMPLPGIDQTNNFDNIWRDDLDADGVGEENFEDLTLAQAFRRLRVLSGNRVAL